MAMSGQNILRRRRIRALEAKRDALLEKKTRATDDLAKIRAELKVARSRKT